MKGTTENQRHFERVRAVPPVVPKVQPGTLIPFNLAVATVADRVVIQLQSTLVLPVEHADDLIERLKLAIEQAKEHVEIALPDGSNPQASRLVVVGG